MSSDILIGNVQTDVAAREVDAASHTTAGTRAEGNLDLPEFFSLLYRMMKIDAPSIVLVPAYPKYLRPPESGNTMDNPSGKMPPTVTYRIVRREPATIGGNKEFFGTGYKNFTPQERMREGRRDGTQVVVYGQNFDNEIRFEVWATNNTEAERTVNWFEQYLRGKRIWLRNQGLGEILFVRRSDFQENTSDLGNWLEYRSLNFYVRTEELSLEDESVLKNLEIRLGISS